MKTEKTQLEGDKNLIDTFHDMEGKIFYGNVVKYEDVKFLLESQDRISRQSERERAICLRGLCFLWRRAGRNESQEMKRNRKK